MPLPTLFQGPPGTADARSQPGTRRGAWFGCRSDRERWAGRILAVTVVAALAACGGGGGSNEPTTPANQAPSITLDAPAANANFFSTDTVHITATASDADGTVAKVEFLSDGVKIGEDTAAPYAFDWLNPPVGPHTLTVRAIDNAGATTVSASRTISSAQNQVPTVSMAAPANNFKANAPTAVLLTANASDTDGTIAKVEFFKINPAAPVFDATTLVGQANPVGTPPSYQLTTAPLAAGTYNFAARATDNKGDSATSGSVQVIMNALPTVNITAPTAGANIIPGTNFTLRATASDGDGSISKVEFFLNGSATALGQAARVGATSEYTLAWTAVTGAVSFTARATDNDGAQTTTASVAANVLPNVLPIVTLDNPAAGTNAPTTLNLAASATDGDGTVTGVEFSYALNGGAATKANGVLAAGKWTLAVPIGAAQFGTYAVTATVTDNLGGKTTSPSKNITIAANVPPAVNITSAAAQTLDAGNAPKTLLLSAIASDSDGIAKVEFFNGATKLGEAAAAPFQYSWASVAAGSYSITAKATDNVGTTFTTTAQALEVTPNLLGMWSTLNTTQKAGITLVPDLAISDPGNDAGQVLTAIGTTTVVPAFVVAMGQGLRDMADLPINLTSTDAVACPGGGTVKAFPNGNDANGKPLYAIELKDCKTQNSAAGFTLFGGVDLKVVQPYTNTTADNQCPVSQLTINPPPAPPTCNWPTEVKYTDLGNNQFRILVKAATVSGNGAPAPGGEPFPVNAYSYAYVECTGAGAGKKCVTNLQNSFVWGHDLAWTGWNDNGTTPAGGGPLGENYLTDDPFVLNGTLRPCQDDPQPLNENVDYCKTQPTVPGDLRYHRHFKFDNLTNVGGRAIVYGNNGWSEVKRLPPAASPALPGTELFTVQRTTNNPSTTDASPKTYECKVDINGFWGCVLKP
jgi:hypothetical protein